MWLLNNPWHEKREECNKVYQTSSKNNKHSIYEKNSKTELYDDRIKIEKQREKEQLISTTRISRYATVPFAMFEKYENRPEIKTNGIKLMVKQCIETPLAHNNQGCMPVSIIVLLLYLRKYKY